MNGCLFAEASGLLHSGVDGLFEVASRKVLGKIEAGIMDPRDARGVVVGSGAGGNRVFLQGGSDGDRECVCCIL